MGYHYDSAPTEDIRKVLKKTKPKKGRKNGTKKRK